MKIEETIIIHNSIKNVYQGFYDFKHWKAALPDVLDVDIFYDDGLHQEFSMTVERPSGDEIVKGMRFCFPNKRIDIFQTEPPPIFEKMTGSWFFSDSDEGTCVLAIRHFEPKKNANGNRLDSTEVEKNLKKYLGRNLNYFKNYIEGNNVN